MTRRKRSETQNRNRERRDPQSSPRKTFREPKFYSNQVRQLLKHAQ